MQTGQGTKNLSRGATECNRRQGVTDAASAAGAQQSIEQLVSEYTPAKDRAMIAMRCCVSKQPFNMVKDPHYVEEINLL